MDITEVIKNAMIYKDQHDLNIPASDQEIEAVLSNRVFIPRDYIEILKTFNGGELFVPGTVLYGIGQYKNYPNLFDPQNTSTLFSIPSNYLIIGNLNFGDLICINTDPPYNIVQWDHETDEEFYNWANIATFLNEQIEDYLDYKEGDV